MFVRNRSSMEEYVDENEQAFEVVREATEDEPPTGPEILAELIEELREGIEADVGPDDLALRLWPRFQRLVGMANAELEERIEERFREWQESRESSAAAELGRKGGKKGGRARAEKLTPEERSEIASLAARARWKKAKDGSEEG